MPVVVLNFCNGNGAKGHHHSAVNMSQLRSQKEPMESSKPYIISKQALWIAYKQVKANIGSAGVDGIKYKQEVSNSTNG
jgi:hypothetical protein